MAISIHINNTAYLVPESWDEITIAAMQHIEALPPAQPGEKAMIEAAFAIIAAASGATAKAVTDGITAEDFEAAASALRFIKTGRQTPPDAPLMTHFDLDGERYAAPSSIGATAFGKYIDATQIVRGRPGWDGLAALIACLYQRAEDEHGRGPGEPGWFDFAARTARFAELPAATGIEAQRFFLTWSNVLMGATEGFLNLTARSRPAPAANSTAGSPYSTTWPQATCSSTRACAEFRWPPASINWIKTTNKHSMNDCSYPEKNRIIIKGALGFEPPERIEVYAVDMEDNMTGEILAEPEISIVRLPLADVHLIRRVATGTSRAPLRLPSRTHLTEVVLKSGPRLLLAVDYDLMARLCDAPVIFIPYYDN